MTPAKILIVDDEIELERLVKQRLRKNIMAGEFNVIFAHSGKEAIHLLTEDRQISFVLTDINMPDMDGLTLLEKLPEINPNLKAVVVSAYGNIKNIRAAMNRGALDFLLKPIDFEDFLVTIRKSLQFVKQIQENFNELQQMQLQLIQVEKMSALGNLVAGVAHEINNPVGFLSGNIQPALDYVSDLLKLIDLYQEKYPDPDPDITDEIEAIDLEYMREDLPKLISSMAEGVNRIRTISDSLRIFSRADKDYKVPFNIHEGLDSTLLILKHRLKANELRPTIEVIRKYGDFPPIECFPGQLNQVFMNLLANAIDALEESNEGRTFTEIQADPNQITIETSAIDSNSVLIRISDNGVGMTEAVKQQIFDHLFTTKAVGKGTGLGLSIAYQIIVEKHRGTIEVDSQLGKGTHFLISLPIKTIRA